MVSEHLLQAAQTRTDAVTITTAVFLGVAWLAVSLRFWVRGVMIESIGWDDWTMLATNVVFTGYCTSVFMMNMLNPGLMLGDETWAEAAYAINLLMSAMTLYVATTVFIKVALGLFYLRIMIQRWQRYTIYGTVAFSALTGIAFFLFTIFQCGNPTRFLERQIEGKCAKDGPLLAFNIMAGLVNALADWVMALLPIFVLRKAQMPMPAKISAGCLMLLGSVGSVCSVLRLIFLNDFKPGPYFFWTCVTLSLWSIAECGLCITAASMATLRPLFRCCMQSARSTFGGNSEGSRATASRRTGRSSNRRESAIPLSELSSEGTIHREKGMAYNINVQDDRTLTTVIGNSRVMEKMGVTHDAIRKARGAKGRAEPQPVGSPPMTGTMATRLENPFALPDDYERLASPPDERPVHLATRVGRQPGWL